MTIANGDKQCESADRVTVYFATHSGSSGIQTDSGCPVHITERKFDAKTTKYDRHSRQEYSS